MNLFGEFVSNYKEFHSFGIGLMDGLTHKNVYSTLEKAQEIPDVNREPHYYRAGYFVSNRVKWVICAGVLSYGF